MTAETVDMYMGPVLEAALTGDFDKIKTPPFLKKAREESVRSK
jgi:hypothetical protein